MLRLIEACWCNPYIEREATNSLIHMYMFVYVYMYLSDVVTLCSYSHRVLLHGMSTIKDYKR